MMKGADRFCVQGTRFRQVNWKGGREHQERL